MAGGNGQALLVAGGVGVAGVGVAGDVGSAGHDADDPAADPSHADGLNLKNFEKLPACEVAVGALSPGPGLRQSGTDAAHVHLLVDASGAAELPPLLVQEDGWRVIDGVHRLEAAKLRGDSSVKARFVDCTDSEALVLAMKANSSHGLPLSKADRVFGAKSVLAAHPDWSDRAIATITGLSAKTIASLRGRSAAGGLGDKRLGRDGKRRPVTPGEGRLRAAEYITAHPDAPLRQVARETDVSLGTVHDVRARLRRGVNPERNGHRPTAAPPPDASAESPAGPAARPVPRAVRRLPDEDDAAPPPDNSTPLRRRNHADLPPTWPQIVAKMANDPAVRYTDSGKEFLRWMSLHAADPQRWREFLNTVPAHWQTVIAPMAEAISQEWSLFAQQLRNRQETA
ncbi:ParB/RepB/Spo0J family partition protein [Actinomadura sp. 7K534]|uniref:ParB/RepB/Spo0J family partition protein n=1 Tax=Actinomadura sp. 7K534 TaxID=2530366 RepID=UPI0010489FC9|nr:ParB/RepB/Spo0J family partition protein [Actinomadura sp. 7K534]TDB97376.1 nuclease [Actinomadura sp. 7K534]